MLTCAINWFRQGVAEIRELFGAKEAPTDLDQGKIELGQKLAALASQGPAGLLAVGVILRIHDSKTP